MPDGYGYIRFCDLYRKWCETISPTMRQVHESMECLYLRWSGPARFADKGAYARFGLPPAIP
jgi:hypothetical protein